MTPELNPMDPALERALMEIRGEEAEPAVVEAAAARVWARVAEAAGHPPAEHIRGCADFQALIPEYRAGRLTAARALLLKDHLNQCVACRRVYEGKVVAFPAARPAQAAPRRMYYPRWAAAAVVVAATGVSIWLAVDRYGTHTGRALVQTVNGSLYEISAAGIRPLAAGQDLPAGAEIRTAKDSGATLELWDGSTVEVHERSALSSSQSGKDITVQVDRGSIIVQAAKRRAGHLYVTTADCRVAVTGTVFSVNAGVKGSRISVIQGEVRMAQDAQEKVLRPGDQAVTGSSLEQAPIQYDISWSRNGNRLGARPASSAPRRVSPLLEIAPASTVVFATLPDAAESLKDAQASLRQAAEQNPQLRVWLAERPANVEPLFARLQSAGEYLGEVALLVVQGADHRPQPVFLASTKRPGLGDFLKKAGLPIAIEERPGVAAFGPGREAVREFARALDGPRGGFHASPCYARLAEAQREGATTMVCADISRLGQPAKGVRYFLGEDGRVNGQPTSRLTVGFDGPRAGIAAWLAAPAPMGSLDYVTSDAAFVAAFVVTDPAAIMDQTLGLLQDLKQGADKAMADARQQTGADVHNDLASSLGGEFALALDGPLLPTPSWKLIAEVYDPARFQTALQAAVDAYNRGAVKSGGKPWRTSRETVDGRTYYMIGAADPNPLTEASYTFDDGYLIAGPSRAIVNQALRAKTARASIARSTKFVSLMPRDSYANFSAVMYEDLGAALAPIAGLLGSLAPPGAAGRGNPLQSLASPKPALVAAYGEPDRITVAGNGGLFGTSMNEILRGNLLGVAGRALPLAQLQGTRGRQSAF